MLHILNSDATAKVFEKTGIKGQCIVWREMLSEGPVQYGMSESDFWDVRAKFFSETIGETKTSYNQKIIKEMQRFNDFKRYREIILWFEHDLMCQINLIYILNWFSKKDLSDVELSLICVGSHPEIEKFMGLGQLSPEQLGQVIAQKKKITKADLHFAKEFWHAYTAANPEGLKKIQEKIPESFQFLNDALNAHYERFPSSENGLNSIEQKILELIDKNMDNSKELIHCIQREISIYGMTKVIILDYLKQLNNPSAEVIKLGKKIEITSYGKELLAGYKDYFSTTKFNRWLGGVHLTPQNDVWRWDRVTKVLFKTWR